MNNIKGSIVIKALIHIALFLSGLILLISSYHIFNYLDSYKTSITDFKETEAFQSKYLKYVERVAMYVDYREKGYNGTVISDISAQDLSSLFEKNVDKESASDKNTNQDLFDYYNTILNQKNSNFIYYVKNIKTGKVYCSAVLEDTLLSQKDDKEISLDEYLSMVKKSNPAYLILNTETKKFATNVNRGYHYISYDYLSWVIDYIKGTMETTDEGDTYRGDYIIVTTLASDLPNKFDEFGSMNEEFNRLYVNFQESQKPLPISLVLLITLFILSIAVAGHKKNSSTVALNGFDRVKSELGFLIIVIGIILLYILARHIVRYMRATFGFDKPILLAVAYFIIYPYCMFGFLSLIRRLKASTLYSNSIFNSLSRLMKQVVTEFFKQRGVTYRLSLILILFTVVQIFAFYLYHHPLFGLKGIVLYLLLAIPNYLFLILVLLKSAVDYSIIRKETKKLAEGNLTYKIPTDTMREPALSLAMDINNISDGLSLAVEEKVKSERFKTELIANVSHDIKTPLTSIINYVDLLKKENIENENAKNYLEILTSKTWRLKTLIEDLMEASKASTGAITMTLECLNLVELVRQSLGEFEDKFISHNLEVVLNIKNEPIYIMADGRSTYRIIENMLSNVNKYALSNTRVYVDLFTDDTYATVSIKNISRTKLNINADELMERFVRGDASRNTEGSGLGLSIARSLASLQDAIFDIELDGDLFKAIIRFRKLEHYTNEVIVKNEKES